MKSCGKCGVEKSEDAFAWRKKNVSRASTCKECQKVLAKSHYENNKSYYKNKSNISRLSLRDRGKRYIVEYLRTHPCVDCGESDIEVLEFDHVVPLNSFSAPRVGSLVERSVKRIAEEIAKCEVRCANCHVRRTRRMAGTLRMPR